VRIVIGEDQALMREGLGLVLERAGFTIVAVAADAERPELVVADIQMPPPTPTTDCARCSSCAPSGRTSRW
jgi:DNA-binding NarL/FixJ family response regulator